MPPLDRPGALASAIVGAVGQPSSVRVGTVSSVEPLEVNLQGQTYGGDSLGVLGGAMIPPVGSAVVLVGQSTTEGSDPASWVALGGITPAGLYGVTRRNVQTAVLATLSTSYVDLATTCGTAFKGPASGNALVMWRSYLENSTVGSGCLCSPEIRTGAVVGSGSPVVAASDTRALLQTGVEQIAVGSMFTVFGFTPGEDYNIRLLHRATANTASFAWREVIVLPIP